MKIDIWSDIMCPFCYIGKRKLETALQQFDHKDKVEITWHSFQLDAAMQPQPGKDIHTYLAERKGQSREWSVRVHNQMTDMAKKEGLEYNFDKAVIANSFDAHRLIQLAKTHGKGDVAEEMLFKAYFTDGRNISNHNTLLQIGIELGLSAIEVGEMLSTDSYAEVVNDDIERARALGINGVPFFVIDGKYGISGAQPAEVFLNGLQQAWTEQQATIANTEDNACTADGVCKTEVNV